MNNATSLYTSVNEEIAKLEKDPMIGYCSERKAVIDLCAQKASGKRDFKKMVMAETGLTSKGFSGDIYAPVVMATFNFKRS